jgi:aurora kinase
MAVGPEPFEGDVLGRYVLDTRIENGSFGVVFKCRRQRHLKRDKQSSTEKTYAIKIYHHDMGEDFRRQIDLWRSLRHKNILELIDFSINKRFLVCEYMALGDLFNATMSPTQIHDCLYDTLRGLRYMHRSGIAHCDIKSENLLRNQHGKTKIADFDFTQRMPFPLRKVGTRLCMAPECFDHAIEQTGAVDVWAVGVLCYEFITGLSPFDGVDGKTIDNNIKALRYDIPTTMPPDAAQFIRSTLCPVAQRATVDTLLASSFMCA